MQSGQGAFGRAPLYCHNCSVPLHFVRCQAFASVIQDLEVLIHIINTGTQVRVYIARLEIFAQAPLQADAGHRHEFVLPVYALVGQAEVSLQIQIEMLVQLASCIDTSAPNGMVQVEVERIAVIRLREITESNAAELEYRSAQADFPCFLFFFHDQCVGLYGKPVVLRWAGSKAGWWIL